MLSTFAFVTFAWIFFRSQDMMLALNYVSNIFTSIIENPHQLFHLPGGKTSFIYIIPLIIGDWYLRRDERKLSLIKNSYLRYFTYLIIIILVFWKLDLFSGGDIDFIYFQF
jgi:hypothetical protein